MADQREVNERGGTMRLGLWPCQLQEGSLAHKAYGKLDIQERHRHRYEVNNDYRERLIQAGLTPTGVSPDGTLVEIVECKDHPWFLAVQFHPEFLSKPTKSHPLFRDFIGASLLKRQSKRADLV